MTLLLMDSIRTAGRLSAAFWNGFPVFPRRVLKSPLQRFGGFTHARGNAYDKPHPSGSSVLANAFL